jgi:hypothetical protein
LNEQRDIDCERPKTIIGEGLLSLSMRNYETGGYVIVKLIEKCRRVQLEESLYGSSLYRLALTFIDFDGLGLTFIDI